MNQKVTQALAAILALASLALLLAQPVNAHETDQYTLPRREFADLGPYLNEYMYDAIDEAVRNVNQRISAARKANRESDVKRLQEDAEIVRAVNGAFPNAMAVIEGLDSRLGSASMRDAYPSTVCGYKEPLTNIYEHAHFILDPRQLFRIWLAKTFDAYGTYMGGDKIGHFTDMGMNYWVAYNNARRKGANEEEATAAAVSLGTQGLVFSESGMLGYLSAGSYSNGDMVANYLGFVFYRNLTAPMLVGGKQVPAMLVRDGDLWAFAPHVQRDNDFFAAYIDPHMCEALNPSHYESGMRTKIREAVKERQADLLERYADENGLRRPMRYFEVTARECVTYYGVNYGHRGAEDELITLANTCFDPLPADAGVNDRNDRGYTPLHDAVIRGDLPRINALIKAGANVNSPIRSKEVYSSEWGATPIHLAARDGQREIVETLIKAGANPKAADDRGATPLHYGAYSAEIESLLVDRGADANARDVFGRTPLHWAVNLGRADAVEALLQKGAKPSTADRSGATPLHLAAARADVLSMSRLLDGGAPIAAADRFGRTPLHEASTANDPEAVNLLVRRGAKPQVTDSFGMTPLHDAARVGRGESAKALLQQGASATATDLCGITPLHLAARGGHESCVQAMLARGADANARSKSGITPLHEAAFCGRPTTIMALTDAGSDRSARDTLGRTPRDIAQKQGHRSVLAMLAVETARAMHATAEAEAG